MALFQPVIAPQSDATIIAPPAREKALNMGELERNAIFFTLGLYGQIVGVILRCTKDGLLECSFDNGYSFDHISNGYEPVPGKPGVYLVCKVDGSNIVCSLVMNEE